jgi:pilus assembly protein Flp/PilA
MLRFYMAAMHALTSVTDRLERDDKGATAVEYGLMVALIAGVIILAVTTLGGNLRDLFNTVATKITGAGG